VAILSGKVQRIKALCVYLMDVGSALDEEVNNLEKTKENESITQIFSFFFFFFFFQHISIIP